MHPEARAALKKANQFDPSEFKRTIEQGRKLGLIKAPGDATAVKLDVRAAAAVDGVRVQFVSVTPDMAKTWLLGNQGNRSLRQSTVTAYARDMLNGDWLLNHQGIAFGENDRLLDGQHRLAAIAQSGCSITMLVSTGWPSQPKGKRARTMDTVDRGAARSISDLLGLQHGIEQPRLVVMTATVLARLCIANPRSPQKLTVPLALGIIEVFRDQVKFVVENRPRTVGLRQAVVLGAVAFAHGVLPKETAEFYQRLQTGENLARNNPILPLRNWLLSDGTLKINGSKSGQVAAAADILHHLFLFSKALPAEKLTHSSEGLRFFAGRQVEAVNKIQALIPDPQ